MKKLILKSTGEELEIDKEHNKLVIGGHQVIIKGQSKFIEYSKTIEKFYNESGEEVEPMKIIMENK
jgi:hypothetical protein